MEKTELRPAEKLALKMSMRMRRGESATEILREYIRDGIIAGPEDSEGCKALVYLATFYAAHIII
jgi:hypothetical protein